MEPADFEALSRSVVTKISFALRQKDQFKSRGQLHRAIELEDELYKKVNLVRGAGDQYAEVWNDTHGVRLYTQTTEELIEKITSENGPYWRRVEGGTISAKHILTKFCPTMQVVAKPKRKRATTPSSSAAATPTISTPLDDPNLEPATVPSISVIKDSLTTGGGSATPSVASADDDEPSRKKHKKDKKKKHKKKHHRKSIDENPLVDETSAVEVPVVVEQHQSIEPAAAAPAGNTPIT